jgi:hypothetical protein
MSLQPESSQETVDQTKSKGFDATVASFLNKFYDFKMVTEEKCKYAANDCDCDGCDDCVSNQK